MSTLHDRLSDLAEDAAATPHAAVDADLWTLGRRQHRHRQVGAALTVAAALVLVVGLGAVFALRPTVDRTTPPADVPFSELHLPRTVHAPDPWAPGTDEAGPLGPLAAVGLGTRVRPEGLTGEREGDAAFGVSAVDGTMRWLDLPDATRPALGFRWLALSPAGTKVDYPLSGPGGVAGWGVYDTTTGATVELRDPAQPLIEGGVNSSEIRFSGDSRYLQTNYPPEGSDVSRDHLGIALGTVKSQALDGLARLREFVPDLEVDAAEQPSTVPNHAGS